MNKYKVIILAAFDFEDDIDFLSTVFPPTQKIKGFHRGKNNQSIKMVSIKDKGN